MFKLPLSIRSLIRITLMVALSVLGVSSFWSYRVRAATDKAAEFAPTETGSITVPAGTAIRAVIRSGIDSSAEVGDTVNAFVLTRVDVGDKVAVSVDTAVKGEIEDLTMAENKARVQVRFTGLIMPNQDVPLATRPVDALIPIRSDVEIVSNTFKMLIGASVGAALGAASEDNRMISSGVIEGARSSASVTHEVPVTIVLIRAVNLIRS